MANGHNSCSLFQGFGVRVPRGGSAGVNAIEPVSLFRPTSKLLLIRKPEPMPDFDRRRNGHQHGCAVSSWLCSCVLNSCICCIELPENIQVRKHSHIAYQHKSANSDRPEYQESMERQRDKMHTVNSCFWKRNGVFCGEQRTSKQEQAVPCFRPGQ